MITIPFVLVPSERRAAGALPMLDGLGSAVRLVWPFMVGLAQEEVRVLLVNSDCRVIGFPRIARGDAHEVVFTVGDVLRPVLRRRAAGLVLVHNHPAGDVRPSAADRAVTQLVQAVMAPLSIIFIDHLIVGNRGVFSFRQHGLLADGVTTPTPVPISSAMLVTTPGGVA